MRDIYSKLRINTPLSQGSIINHCIAIDYDGFDAYGLIVTPRCDMAHGIKVSSVHYIPVIPLGYWKELDLWNVISERLRKDLANNINDWVSKEYDILDFTNSAFSDYSIISSWMDQKNVKEKLQEAAKLYYNYSEENIKQYVQKFQPKLKNKVLTALFEGDLPGFYLIENWDNDINPDPYMVAILREVHHIPKKIALKYNLKFLYEEIQDEPRINGHIYQATPDNSENFLYGIVAQIKSPFIEHIMQSFSYNFTRIGVDDPDSSEWQLHINTTA